jgi:hypothetical protein
MINILLKAFGLVQLILFVKYIVDEENKEESNETEIKQRGSD